MELEEAGRIEMTYLLFSAKLCHLVVTGHLG